MSFIAMGIMFLIKRYRRIREYLGQEYSVQ